MAKQGMKRPENNSNNSNNNNSSNNNNNNSSNNNSSNNKNEQFVSEIQGKAKCGNEKANPIISGNESPSQKVSHTNKGKK